MTDTEKGREILLRAAEQFATPLYVYDMGRIDANLAMIKAAFGGDIQIQYAGKALMNGFVLRHLRHRGCGVDTVSQQEVELAMHYGYSPGEINYTPSGAPLEELIWAVDSGVMVHVDNPEMLDSLGQKRPGTEIALRFNPKVRSGGHVQLQVGAEDSKFGLYREEFALADELIQRHGLVVKRIHVHVGSDVKTAADFMQCWKQSFELAATYSETVDTLDLGGGYGVKYHKDDQALDMHDLGRQIRALQQTYEQRTGHRLRLMIEPGKSVVGDAGYFLVAVSTVKKLSDRTIVYVNSGFNHFIRPMYYGARHRIENVSRPDGPVQPCKVVGYLCETDTFAEAAGVAEVRRGDVLCFHNAGAYSMSMASNYNSRLRPAEVVVKGDELILTRRRETFDDLVRYDVEHKHTTRSG